MNFGVAGNPVSHSLSPFLFDKYHKVKGQEFVYSRILSRTHHDILQIAGAFDLQGLNITAPFKQDILKYSDEISPFAKEIKAANTICFNNNTISAYNTDIAGIQVSILKKAPGFRPYIGLVIGAGGAARAAIKALKNLNTVKIYVSNRNPFKAKNLASEMNVLEITEIGDLEFHCDIIINTTPVFPAEIEKTNVSADTIIIDADYINNPLKAYSEKLGAIYIDGIEWLTHQGVASYQIMTGIINNGFTISNDELKHSKNAIRKIALIGLMGTGKSTMGKKLAQKLGYDFIDTDKLIEENEGQSISSIFKNKGEDHFRHLETEALKKALNHDPIVIATGGGIITRDENIALLKEKCWNILLFESPDVLAEKLSESNRPLLKGRDKMETLNELFQERKNRYYKTSDVVICTENETYNNIIELIYEDINKSPRLY